MIELLSSLVEKKVRFLIVGGYALAYHYEPRYTKDIDIWIDNKPSNAKLVYSVLEEFGAPIKSITSDFFTFDDHFFKMGKAPLRVDFICGMDALEFSKAWKSKKKGTLFGVPLFFIGLDELIILKKAAGRPQDLVDLGNLKKRRAKRN